MNADLELVLADLEHDAGLDAGELFAHLAAGYFRDTRSGDGHVSTRLSPADLSRRFDEPMPAAGRPLPEVVERLRREVLRDCNRLSRPRAMGHQVSAPLPVAVWAEPFAAALNQSGAVWEMSPVGTVLEARVIRWMCDLAEHGCTSTDCTAPPHCSQTLTAAGFPGFTGPARSPDL